MTNEHARKTARMPDINIQQITDKKVPV